ncbi:hypothetical protein [Nocardiopsis sp. MG754419]|uniref:hypothetical protein n=1 Tax=Nocardiopsis sp. MG754419 TaxID=2259865 RepID=UPI001BA696CE|nr:hypothetical protein [Nocardiopsis sp. MG754419]MBR8744108.1 hypothetical protein [Nocardiopsis sp. MG754419]
MRAAAAVDDVFVPLGSGTVRGPSDIRIAARDEFATTFDIALSNLTVIAGVINEQPCAEHTREVDVVWKGARDGTC